MGLAGMGINIEDSSILPPVAGKTGTAEDSSGGSDHSWFAGFKPYEYGEIIILLVSLLFSYHLIPIGAICTLFFLSLEVIITS